MVGSRKLSNDEVEGISVKMVVDKQPFIKVGSDACFAWNHHVENAEVNKNSISNSSAEKKNQKGGGDGKDIQMHDEKAKKQFLTVLKML